MFGCQGLRLLLWMSLEKLKIRVGVRLMDVTRPQSIDTIRLCRHVVFWLFTR